uniref:Uncharacterized protein n=1 Tax=Arundo donax TaxID=35708 RepID=A0A0A9C1Z5_ARUDO
MPNKCLHTLKILIFGIHVILVDMHV